MKYWSDVTKCLYETPEEVENAEKALFSKQAQEKAEKEKLAAERKARAAEVEKAREAMVEARTKYKTVLEKFCEDYGSFHTSVNSREIPTLFDLFNIL